MSNTNDDKQGFKKYYNLPVYIEKRKTTEYRQKHKESHNRWKSQNPEKYKDSMKKCYEKNKEKYIRNNTIRYCKKTISETRKELEKNLPDYVVVRFQRKIERNLKKLEEMGVDFE